MNQADPTVRVAQTVVDYDTGTEVAVEFTQSTAHYQLTIAGAPVGAVVQGNGGTIVLPTGPLREDTEFVIRAAKVSHSDIYADLQQRAAIRVRPNTQLAVSAADAVIDSNGRTEIRIQASQSGVLYQLTVAGRPLGSAVTGNGGTIALSTGSLKADTIFVVRATKVSDADIAVDLAQRVQVTVRPDGRCDDLEARAAESLACAQRHLCAYRYEDAIREAERGLERGCLRQQFQALLEQARADLVRLESLLETFNRQLSAGDYDQAGTTLDEVYRLAPGWNCLAIARQELEEKIRADACDGSPPPQQPLPTGGGSGQNPWRGAGRALYALLKESRALIAALAFVAGVLTTLVIYLNWPEPQPTTGSIDFAAINIENAAVHVPVQRPIPCPSTSPQRLRQIEAIDNAISALQREIAKRQAKSSQSSMEAATPKATAAGQ